MLLTRDTLIERLDELLEKSHRIDLAVAWATDCNALARLCKFAKNGGAFRAIVGILGNATHPNALRNIQRCAQLRIASGALFHPKFYLFHQPHNRLGWIGSANLTRPGFEQNEELIYEFSDDDGTASQWFDGFWTLLDKDCSRRLDEYESGWQPPSPPPRSLRAPPPGDHEEFYRVAGNITDWPSFVAAIDQANEYWSDLWNRDDPVTGDTHSWLNTITLGRAVMHREDWSELSQEDFHLMLGRGYWGYGLLGAMGGAGLANNVFNEATRENLSTRRRIRQALQPVIDASDAQFAEAACAFIAELGGVHGFAGAVATRFLALARPDRAISVNNGSRERLSQLTKLPKNTLGHAPHGHARSYMDVLGWFEHRDRDWYSRPAPKNARERLLASNRAALFDAFVYEEA